MLLIEAALPILGYIAAVVFFGLVIAGLCWVNDTVCGEEQRNY